MRNEIPLRAITTSVCITAVLIAALIKGVNGVLLATGLSLLAGVGGFVIGRLAK